LTKPGRILSVEARKEVLAVGMYANLRAVARVVLRTRNKQNADLFHLLARRPGIAFGVGAFEMGLHASGRADARLKALADLKTSSLIGCPF
jgi:hypothetical protein